MNKLITMSAFALGLAFSPAFAQTKMPAPTPGPAKSAAECQSMFKSADKNNDGMLDKTEIDANKVAVPTTLSTNSSIAMQDFLSACSATATDTPRK